MADCGCACGRAGACGEGHGSGYDHSFKFHEHSRVHLGHPGEACEAGCGEQCRGGLHVAPTCVGPK